MKVKLQQWYRYSKSRSLSRYAVCLKELSEMDNHHSKGILKMKLTRLYCKDLELFSFIDILYFNILHCIIHKDGVLGFWGFSHLGLFPLILIGELRDSCLKLLGPHTPGLALRARDSLSPPPRYYTTHSRSLTTFPS